MYIQEDNDGRREEPPEFYLRAHTRRDGMVQDAVRPIYVRSGKNPGNRYFLFITYK